MRVLIAIALLLALPGAASAACSKSTLQGNYASGGTFTYYYDGFPSIAAGIVHFNGGGKITLKSLTEGAYGDRATVNGGGSYSVNSNCVGTAKLNIRSNGQLVGTANLNFAVGGTKALPEILGIYTNQRDGITGSIRLIKSNH
ncbi:hypothetical protein EYC87_05355 [Halieaceae bacterium IMCC8485]|jgi:hypothetical protein|uniref:Uncharacterized protein n=1 Tax=Candidatus Seongchinamella marina TaxID=2518990 RepID=A0ABT3SSP3_9GAMM|nr:hypothetical protein [Candidatus Seongchinamella marina]MCX2973011.1 hypothetical protein [Candidatus Seongchinamella marina]